MAQDTKQPESRCVLVLGVHGSGTSAVAGVLHELGVMMGERLVPAAHTSPKGHFEDSEFRHLLYAYRDNESVLGDMKTFLEDRFARFPLWGLKEPAINEAVKALAPTLSKHDYRVIAIDRDKFACARSYNAKWRKDDIKHAIDYHKQLRRRQRRFLEHCKPPVLKIKYNALTDDVQGHVKSIVAFAFEGLAAPSAERIERAVRMVDPSLNHHRERDQER